MFSTITNLSILLSLLASTACLDYLVETDDTQDDYHIQPPPPQPQRPATAKPTQNITVPLGKRASLPCFVQPNRKFIWMHTTPTRDKIISIGDTVITGDSRARIDSACSPDTGCWKSLHIDKVQLEDAGVYICQADTMRSARVYLNVLVAPYLNGSPRESLTVSEGADIELVCDVDGRPRPSVSWYLGQSVSAENSLLAVGRTLHLRNLSRHSHKRYECVAVNGVNPALSRTFVLSVEFRPVLKKLEIKNNCEWANGLPEEKRGLVVGCHVNGSPTSGVTWYVNGSRLDAENTAVSREFKYKLSEIKGLYSNVFSKLEIEVDCLLI